MPEQGERLVYEYGPWTVDLARRELLARQVPVPLGARAFEIVEVLVQSAGQLVIKHELMDRIWPGAFVEDNTLQVHISAVRKAFGADRGLLKTVSGRGYRLLGSWTSRKPVPTGQPREVSPAPSAGRPLRNNLPLAVSELIGRAASVRTLRDLISAHRLVTLIGPGGIGKTSLALEVVRGLLPSFQGDVWFVELASLSDPGLVCSTVAGVLGLEPAGNEISPQSIARAIGTRKALLLLDNCEHVIDAAASLAEAIVLLCPRIAVLATSREALRIDGEVGYRVPPLDVPAGDSAVAEDLLRHGAVQLLNARVQALRSGFAPTGNDLAAMAAICRRLDGIPLAIEFAAASAATLGFNQILSRLEDRFGLLTRAGRRTALPRHQTLRATLDWSFELLPEAERRILRALGVFAAGFTLEAAAAVVCGPGEVGATAEGIANLVDKSLVTLDANSAPSRWRLLETTRAYALEKLGESGETERVMRRLAGFLRELFTAGPASQSGLEGLPRYVSEVDNVRAALDWAFSPAGDAGLGIALTAAFVPAWLHLSLLVECRERISQALEQLEAQASPDAELGMQLHIALGLSLLYTTGLVVRSAEVLADGLRLAEQLNDLGNQLTALWALWFYHMGSGELRDAEPLAGGFLALARQSADPENLLLGDQIIGSTMHYKGDQPEARRCFERVLGFPDPPAGQRHTGLILSHVRMPPRAMLARVLLLQGSLDQASRDARSSFEDEAGRGPPLSICNVLRYAVCFVAFATADLATAERSVAMLNDLAQRHGSAFWSRIGRCLEGALLIKRGLEGALVGEPGELATGTALLRAALDTVRNRPPDLLAVLAEGLAGLGAFAEAVATIDERLARSDETAERWCDPELLRIKGEVVLQWEASRSTATAESCFQSAVDLARQQGALLWELRATLSLARLQLRQERPDEVRSMLAPVYARFTEGFDTADLRSARELLDALSDRSCIRIIHDQTCKTV